MAKKPVPKKRVKRKEAEAVEVEPDAWDRFKQTMDKVAPPKHATPPNKTVIKKKAHPS